MGQLQTIRIIMPSRKRRRQTGRIIHNIIGEIIYAENPAQRRTEKEVARVLALLDEIEDRGNINRRETCIP